MANVLINADSMTAIANAIRTKSGSQDTYKPAQMADAIINIPTQGVTPTGTKQISITANGTTTEDVTNYANAEITVNVQGGGGLPNHINSVNTVTLDSTATNMVDLSNLIIQSAGITKENGHVYFISLIEKEEANYVSKQMITATLIGTNGAGGGCRYNNGYLQTYVNASYDAANEIGDKYMIIDLSF